MKQTINEALLTACKKYGYSMRPYKLQGEKDKKKAKGVIT